MLRSGGTVETDDIDAHAFKNGKRRADIRAEQHATGRVERYLSLNRQIYLTLVEGFVKTADRGFDFENILRGFDEEEVHAAADQTDSLFAENVDEFVEADVGKLRVGRGGEVARGPDGAGDETWLICFACIFICESAREACGGFVDFDYAVTQFIFRHRDAVGTEGVRFEHVHAYFEKRAMDFFHCFRI